MAAARKVSPAASTTVRALGAELGGELADGGGLAGAVDADDEDDMRLQRRVDDERPGDRREHLLDLVGEHGLDLVVADLLVVAAGAERIGDRRGGVEAEIGA